MRDLSADRLLQAVLAVRGEGPAADGAEAEMPLAAILVEARRLHDAGERCPARARRRAHALFEHLPDGLWQGVARLVFDSWQELAPAVRSLGSERLMVYESGVGAMDLQLGTEEDGEGVILALAVQGGGDELVADVKLDDGQSSTLALDEHGTGSLALPAGIKQAVVVVRDADGELLRTPPVPLG